MAKKKIDPVPENESALLEQEPSISPELSAEGVQNEAEHLAPDDTAVTVSQALLDSVDEANADAVETPTSESAIENTAAEEDAAKDIPMTSPDTAADANEYESLLQELGEKKEPTPDGPIASATDSGEGVNPDAPLLLAEDDSDGVAAEAPSLPEEVADVPNLSPAYMARRGRVLTIDAKEEIQTAEEQEATIWHEIQNAYRTRRILTGTLDAIEKTESGLTLAIVTYKGFRVAIPLKEMMLHIGRMPTGEEYADLMEELNRIINSRVFSEIDFVVKGIENKSRSIVASRTDAMLKKRQTFYMEEDEFGEPMIYEGRVVQARVVAVAEKMIRVEVFGVETSIRARGLSWEWISDAREHFSVGDRILVRVLKIDRSDVGHITISADVRSVSSTTNYDNLRKCIPQSRYAGRVTDVRNGVVYIRLNNGANAIAHSCYDRRTPGKNDDISFAVTRIDEEQGVAVGIITRIIKQNL